MTTEDLTVSDNTAGLVLFLTAERRLGLGPAHMGVGDEVVFLERGLCPFVMRKKRGYEWTLIWECYLDGRMSN